MTKKKALVSVGIAIVLGGILWASYLRIVHHQGWADWTGFGAYTLPSSNDYRPAKTLWDWLQLLVAPLVISFFLWSLNTNEKRRETRDNVEREKIDKKLREQKEENDRNIENTRRAIEYNVRRDSLNEQRLQTYIDKISELILEKGLLDGQILENKVDMKRIVQVRTISLLNGLNTERKEYLLNYLYMAGLIGNPKMLQILISKGMDDLQSRIRLAYQYPVVSLLNTDFRQVQMHGKSFQYASLMGVRFNASRFISSVFDNACLSTSDFSGATLAGCFFRETIANLAIFKDSECQDSDFTKAHLEGADFTDASLDRAIFDGAHLVNSKILWQQLEQAESWNGAIMPNGEIYNANIPLSEQCIPRTAAL
ncbi:MAG: pentapeptide repeat-containing protein [Cyanobacteria bacterium J06634_6]